MTFNGHFSSSGIERPVCANNANTHSKNQPDCHEGGAPLCAAGLTGGGDKLSLTVVNPLAWDRDDAVHFRLPGASVAVAVTDAAVRHFLAQFPPF